MPQQFTIWCIDSVRDEFDEYCSRIAMTDAQRRLTGAFEAFHLLLSGGIGVNPPIRYVAEQPVLKDAIDVEIKIDGVRFCIRAELDQASICLDCIDMPQSRNS